eukprot:CFRG4052T1
MFTDAPTVFGLDQPARCVASLQGSSDATRFFVGTQALNRNSQIVVLDYNDEQETLSHHALNHTDGEVWHVSSCPTRHNVIATAYSSIDDRTQTNLTYGAALWRLPAFTIGNVDDDEVDANGDPLLPIHNADNDHDSFTKLLDLSEKSYGIDEGEQGNTTEVTAVLWSPTDNVQISTLTNDSLQVWDLNAGKRTHTHIPKDNVDTSNPRLRGGKFKSITTGRWVGGHGHGNGTEVALVTGADVLGYDLRSSRQTFHIQNAHDIRTRDIDFNPNKPYFFVSGGDDGAIKFWDCRMPQQPVKTMRYHTHWVWAVRYNHFHDQLILTSGSDCSVVLSNVTSLSSEFVDTLSNHGSLDSIERVTDSDSEYNNEKVSAKKVDRVVRKFDEHEDSVYSVEWSAADPWLFASLSLDGRLVVNHVPRDTKYDILL